MTTVTGEFGAVNSSGIVSAEEEHLGLGWKPSPPPDPALISEECLSAAEEAAEQVLNCIHPTLDSEEKRRDVIDYVQQLVKSHLNCEAVSYGSVPLKTYLPDGDIDLTVLKGPNAEESLAHDVLAVFQDEEQNEDAEYQVKDTQFIDAEVKLVKCLVRNIVIDISFNQLGGLSTLCFLEQVDRLVGRNHLFKRSIILVKTWCYYESRILGAHHGLISTYALETLVLYIFHLFHSSLNGPLEVLYRFLDYYSQFDWDNYCISLKGPVCKSSLPDIVVKMPENAQNNLLLSEEFLENCLVMFSVASRGPEANQKAFQSKHINIIDPLKENNNLGRSVHRGNFYRIRSAFKYGARKLGQVLSQPKDKVADEILKFFSNTRSRHGNEHTSFSNRRLSLDFGDEDSLTTPSLSSPVELLSDFEMLESPISDFDNDSLGAEQTHAQESCISSSNYSASLSENNHFFKPNYSSSKSSGDDGSAESNGINSWLDMNNNRSNNTYRWCMDNSKGNNLENLSLDFREMDSISIGGESEVFNPLADLSGDYDSHIRSLLRGQLCHCFAFSANFLRKKPPRSPSGIQNKKPWDIVRQSMPLQQNKSSEMSAHTISMDHNTMSSAADSALLGTAFQFEGKQKSRGTGTYFPHMNVFCMERPSHGGRNKVGSPGKPNHLHTYGHNNGVLSDSSNNCFEYGNHERSRYRGRRRSDVQCQSPRAVGGGNQINGYLSTSCRIEFGSIGNLAEEVISGAAHVRGSNRDVSIKKQGSMAIMLQERVAGQSIHLKNEDEFPPLCQ